MLLFQAVWFNYISILFKMKGRKGSSGGGKEEKKRGGGREEKKKKKKSKPNKINSYPLY